MENETLPSMSEETEVPKNPKVPNWGKIDLFKILVIFLGVLIVVGLSANAYLMLAKKETVTKTPDSSLTPTPTSDANANWETYTNEKYGFEFKYPNSWFNLGSTDNSGNEYFSTQDIGAPLEMGENDVWLTVYPTTVPPSKGSASKTETLELAGLQIVRSYFEPIPNLPTEQGYVMVYTISSKKGKTSFGFMTFSKKTMDRNQLIFDQILSTFRFD